MVYHVRMTHRLTLLWLTCAMIQGCCSATPSGSSATSLGEKAADPTLRPLRVIQAADLQSFPDDRPPAPLASEPGVTVGRLESRSDPDFWDFYQDWPESSRVVPWSKPPPGLLMDIVTGQERLLAPAAGRETLAFLSGPYLNSDQIWAPADLHRDASTITLIVEHWTDHLHRGGNSPFKPLQLVSLGMLAAGDYTLRVERRIMQFDFHEDDMRGWQWESTQVASMRFKVQGPPPADEASHDAAPTLSLSPDRLPESSIVPAPAGESGVLRDPPGMMPYRFSAGTHSIYNWVRFGTSAPDPSSLKWQLNLGSPIVQPRLAPPDRGDDVCASVICPLRTGVWWVALRKEVIARNDITLYIQIVKRTKPEPAPPSPAANPANGLFGSVKPADPEQDFFGVLVPIDLPAGYPGPPIKYYNAGTYRLHVVWTIVTDDGEVDPSAEERALLSEAMGPVEITLK